MTSRTNRMKFKVSSSAAMRNMVLKVKRIKSDTKTADRSSEMNGFMKREQGRGE